MSSQDDANKNAERLRLLLITGLSGSGKSTAGKALEDVGYYYVDNLPVPLLRIFLEDPRAQVGSRNRIAVVTDARAPGFAEAMPQILREIDRSQIELILVFLEATEETLVRRFSETRRSHPMAGEGRPLVDGIRLERELLAELRGAADLVLDSSHWSVHDFRRELYRQIDEDGDSMIVSFVSFGFKHGLPMTSNLVFDVRFLPNPYFVPELRELTGRDAEVKRFLEEHEEFLELMERLEDLLSFLLPRYRRENRCYLSVAVGCTGGRHRSVAACERLARNLGESGFRVRVIHRDVDL